MSVTFSLMCQQVALAVNVFCYNFMRAVYNDICNNNNYIYNNDVERHNLRFFTISSLFRNLSQTCLLKWPGCSHVHILCKHIRRLSHATCNVPHGMKGLLSCSVQQS